MEDLKNKAQENEAELLSDEAQEVMSRIPPAIIRWGMTVMAVIIAGLILAAALIHWPETVEVPIDGQLQNGEMIITARLSPEGTRFVIHHDSIRVSIFSPMLPDRYSESGATGVISDITIQNNSVESFLVSMKMDSEAYTDSSIFSGTMVLTTSNKSLLKHIIEQVRI